ncbi:MAG: proton-conducting transporter membrane subunit [Clostridia bacterium]|nr:proton-conducting transporter membrane subunit [Clostridia bacterium]
MVIDLLSYSLIPMFSSLALPFFAKKNIRIAIILANVALLSGFINISYLIINSITKPDIIPIIDPLTVFLIFTIYTVALAISFFSTYYGIEKEANPISYYSLILLSVSAMTSLVMVRDLFSLYLFVEILAVCSFALITSDIKSNSIEAAIKYFFLTFPASILIILGISLVLASQKALDFEIISVSTNIMTMIGLSFVIIGFLIKSGVVPFHFWTLDVYQGASSPISAYLAGIITKIGGIYAIIKISIIMKYYPVETISSILLFTSILTILIGAFGAIAQKDMKRMLAYSSISQMGYILAGVSTFSSTGIIAAVFHLFNHATFKTVLFLNSACIEKQTGTTNMTELKGLEKKMPITSWTSIIASMSTAGIPPLSGFWSKILVIIALWQVGYIKSAIIAIIASIITLGYFVLMQRKVFFGKLAEKLTEIKEVESPLLLPVIIMSLMIILAGIYVTYIYSYLEKIM